MFRSAPRAKQKKIAAPVADIAGGWNAELTFVSGVAEHLLFFETDGNRLRGTHQGERGEGELSGTMDGSKVSFRSRLVHRGEHSGYSFSGTLSGGDRIFGEVSLGEYGTARFTARRRSA